MNPQNVCLGPYEITSPHFRQKDSDNTFVNKSKTRQIAVVSTKGVIKPPASDAILLYEELGDTHDVRWYECPSENGRTYTIIPTACEILISSFENGFDIKGGMDASVFGAKRFCYGKIYDLAKGVDESGDECYSSIDFDGHIFQIKGKVSNHSGEYDCGDCWEEVELFTEEFDDTTGEFGVSSATVEVMAPQAQGACCWQPPGSGFFLRCDNHASEALCRSAIAPFAGRIISFTPGTLCPSAITCPSVSSGACCISTFGGGGSLIYNCLDNQLIHQCTSVPPAVFKTFYQGQTCSQIQGQGLCGGSVPTDDPPTPDPMSFNTPPTATSTTTIEMTATAAVDPEGTAVSYYFSNTDSVATSGWQSSNSWIHSSLVPGTTYSYKVKARDLAGNETDWSSTFSATTIALPDTEPPTPDPPRWLTDPGGTSQSTVFMAAEVGSDNETPTNLIEYLFECTSGGACSSSGWTTANSYTDSGLAAETSYAYRFKMKDQAGNETGWSTTKTGTTLSAPITDTSPPSPNPATWLLLPQPTTPTSVRMQATPASDPSGVEYQFDCVSGDCTSSGWQTSSVYEDTGLEIGETFSYRTRYRDGVGNVGNWSATQSAVTEDDDTTPPSPDPPSWDDPPYATGRTSARMTANNAFDISGVEYTFECVNDLSKSSGWQSSRTYSATGLTAGTTYTFRFKVRDKSENNNETGWSSQESAITFGGAATAGAPLLDECESQDDPQTVARSSGDALTAYTARDEDGTSQVRLHRSGTTQQNLVVYYRELSLGCLLNSHEPEFSSVTLEVYDDFALDGEPSLGVGFLTGPLSGETYHVNSIERSFQPNGKPKFILDVQATSEDMQFPDSNDICDVEWFLVDEGLSPFAEGFGTVYKVASRSSAPTITLMDLPCSSMGGVAVDEEDFHQLRGNIIEMEGDRRLGRIEMQFQVDQPTLAYWYVMENGSGSWVRYFTPKMQKVTTITDTTMTIHNSGDIEVSLEDNKFYWIGCILKYPVSTFKREQSASSTYIDNTIPARVRTGHSNRWIVPPCYSTSSNGTYVSDQYSAGPRYWMNLCFDDAYVGDDFPGPPDGSFETGEFTIGEPDTNQTRSESNRFCGNSINPRNTYGGGTHDTSRWLNEFQQYVQAKAGQKLYFMIWSSEDTISASYMEPVWVKEVIADSNDAKWYTSGDINFELKIGKNYAVGVAVREPMEEDGTGFDTKFYYSNSSQSSYLHFFGLNYYSPVIKTIPPANYYTTTGLGDEDILFLQKWTIGSDDGSTMDSPTFCKEDWISFGAPTTSTTGEGFKTHGLRTYFSSSHTIPDSVQVKNFRAWLEVPAGYVNPEVYFYILELTQGSNYYTPIWASGARTISDPLGVGSEGFIYASDVDITFDDSSDVFLDFDSTSYLFAVSWQNIPISMGLKNEITYLTPCSYSHKLMSNSVGPPYPPAQQQYFTFGGTEIPIIDILYSPPGGGGGPALGACCFPDGSCMNLTESECDSVNADWNAGQDCSTFSCIQLPTGACCLAPDRGDVYTPPICVANLTEEQCHTLGAFGVGMTNSTYKGDGSVCTSSTCLTGACCFGPSPSWTCEDRIYSSCISDGGIWRWPGSQCDQLVLSGTECDSYSTGACCVETGVDPSGCVDVDESTCDSYGSNKIKWAGDSTRCSEVDCGGVGLGACCYGNAQCELLSEFDCITLHGDNFGEWQGEFTTCGGQCPNRGICCLPDNSCIFTTPEDCEFQSGLYIRDGGSCVGFSCTEPRGACCFPNGVCEENVTSDECSNNQGTYLGDDTTCSGADCDVQTNIGACCLIDGTCFVGTREECESSIVESEYQGDGTFCSGSSAVECPVIDLTSDEALIVPDHLYLGDVVPSSKPSLALAKNNLMLDGAQYQYVSYQAFEKNNWNVYLRQIRTVINDRESSDPQYQSPFNILERPTFDLSSLLESEFSLVKYTVVDNAVTAPPQSNLCAMFKVTLSDGRGVFNCDEEASGEWTTSCSYGSEFPQTDVYVEAVYDTNTCGAGFDKWTIGATFQGPFPPTPDVLGDAGSGCVTISAKYPDTVDQWCYLQSNCIQSSLIEDDLCPSPYLGITYKPEDLWTLDNDGDTVTRVKYHLGTNILSTTTEIGVSGEGISGKVDFMFVLDYSASMQPRINAVRSAVTPFAQELKNAGIDVQFGLCVYGRADSDDNPSVTPAQPADAFICPDNTSVDNQAMFDGLSGFASSGFTKDVSTLSAALNHWFYPEGAQAPGYSAVQFASLDPRFDWRSDAARYIMLVTDSSDSENNAVCPTYSNNQQAAINVVSDSTSGTNASVILAICDGDASCGSSDGTGYVPMSQASDWGSEQYFPVIGPYDVAFQSIFSQITSDLLQATVVERDDEGFDSTYLKPAEIIISYEGDLTDFWTQDKNQLAFVDNPPASTGLYKDLVNMPFETAGTVYGIEPVHLNGHWERWVYFPEPGSIQLNWPNIGVQNVSRANPIQIGASGINSKVVVNKRNDVFVAYESLEYGMNHIVIKGTGDFAQDSVAGPKGERITRFLLQRDFAYEHYVTLPGEGVNQLCDLVVDNNDVLHITWQSNRDGYWEVYYANGKNLFEPVRVTKSNSRSGHPVIDIDDEGNIFVAYHDNRFGPFEVMLSYKEEKRTLPLLQQDAYLAGYRSGYDHFTNILPILVENPQQLAPVPGQLWGARAQCPEVRFEIVLRTSSRFSFSQTQTNPYDGHQITSLGDLPGGGSFVYVEIWATTHNPDGLGPVGVDLNYDETYFNDPTLLTGPGYSRWFSSLHPAIPREDVGIVNDLGGSSNPDSTLISPYWGILGVVRLTRRPGVDIPSDAELLFTLADVYDPSGGSGVGVNDSNGDPINLDVVSFDSTNVTDDTSKQKTEYNCLHNTGFLYDIEEETGSIGSPDEGDYDFRQGGGEIAYKLAALAGATTGQFYGVTENGLLLLIDNSSNDPYIFIDTNQIEEIGLIDLPTNYSVLDAAVDTEAFHLWVMMGGYDDTGTSIILLLQVNPETAEIVRQSTIYTEVDEIRGSVTCTSGGDFHMITYRDGSIKFSSADYPALGVSTALFDFDDVNIDVGSDLQSGSQFLYDMAADYTDSIFVADDQNYLYTLDKSGGNLSLIDQIDDPGDLLTTSGVLMISSLDGLGYQFTGRTRNLADEDFFNVIIEFYDNKELEGDPSLVIDSRENSEAFINDRVFQDEYVGDEYESSAKGIKLSAGESGYMFFEAAHYRPGYSNKAYPYGFEKNIAYFPKAFSVDESGNVREVESTQTATFSCGKCSATSDNSFDHGSCSYSFVITNNSFEPKYFNFKVDFYADAERDSIVRRFDLLPGEEDLSYCEVDNEPASEAWSDNGLLMQAGDVRFIQVYPSLDPAAGFLCGINYYMRVLSCSSETSVCSDEEFGENFSDAEWDQSFLSDAIKTSSNERDTDILQIQDKLAIAYRSNDGYLKYAEFDDNSWTIESIEEIVDGGVSLTDIDGQPAIAYSTSPGYTLKYAVKDVVTKEWNISIVDDTPGGWWPTLINVNNTPSIAYWGNIGGYPVKRATNTTGVWELETVEITNQSFTYVSEIGHTIVDGKIVMTFANSDNWYYYILEDGTWTSKGINVGGQTTRYVGLVNYDDKPFIAYRSTFGGSLGFLRWAYSSDEGDTWEDYGLVDGSQNGVGEYTTIKIVGGRPAIVYATQSAPYDIKIARLIDLNENRWDIVVVDDDVSYTSGNPRDGRKGLAEFNNQISVFAPINPARVYLSDPERVVSGVKETYFCECSSTIFGDDRLMPLSEIGKWRSSSHGYSDTRITDSPGDSLRPDIVVRKSNNALVTFEDHSDSEPSIKAASFRVIPRTEGFSSGIRNWYDIDSGLGGKNVSTDLDFNEFISVAYEQIVEESTISSELPTNQILLSQLDYRVEDDRGPAGGGPGIDVNRCDIEEMENNIISADPFLAQEIIKKIRIKDQFVQYFTTRNGLPTPVVNTCEVELEIVGSPEVIALRVRNETGGFSSWCPWRPTIGDYTTQIPHNLTKSSGEKEICIQAMTYNGVTTEFCVPVLADYKKIVFGIKLYADEGYSTELRKYDGFFVASITDEDGSVGTDGEFFKTVYLQITPSEPIDAPVINFDVIQQGVGDLLNQEAVYNEEKQLFEGSFDVYREDKVVNIDGLSRVRAKLPGTCEEVEEIVVAATTFSKDIYNVMGDESSQSVEQSVDDVFSDDRNSVTGRLGPDMTIRPSSDPFLIFGDPNYYLKKDEGSDQSGIQSEDDE